MTQSAKQPARTDAKLRTAVPLERSLGYQVNRLSRAMMEKVARITEKHGVNRVHWGYMHHLYADDGLSQRELSDRACRQTATTVSALKRMNEAGLVLVRKNQLDQRKNTVHLTGRGRELTEAIMEDLAELGQVAFKGLTVKEMDSFWRSLNQIRSNFED